VTAAVLSGPSLPAQGAAAAEDAPVLSFIWFAVPYLIAIVYFFTMIDDGSHVLAPALPIAVVLAGALVTAIVARRPPQLNRDVAVLALAYCVVCLVAMAMRQTSDVFALRKLGLPLVGMAPAMFRYYVTPRQMLAFMIVLALVAFFYTTETPDVVSDGFFSTDSPDESILGVVFGALAVWLAASNRWALSAVAYAACLVFFKRNAIIAAPLVVALVVAVQLLRPRWPERTLRRIAVATVAGMAVLAFYLGDLFDLIANQFLRGYSAEFLSVGREPLYAAILGNFERSGLDEQLLGHGPGAVEHVVANLVFLHVDLQLAHDEYLSWLYDFGLVGLLLLMFFFARLARSGLPAAAVLIFVATTMVAENYFLVSFNCLAVFVLLSTHMVGRNPAADA